MEQFSFKQPQMEANQHKVAFDLWIVHGPQRIVLLEKCLKLQICTQPLCPIHIFVIGPTIVRDLKCQDRPRFTLQCDCKFRYSDSTTTYWPGKPMLRITKIYCGQSFSIVATPRQHLCHKKKVIKGG